MPHSNYLVWLDLEMTGLDPESCVILEIATIVTDSQLNIVAEGPNLVIHHPDATLAAMDQWNTTHHGASGLTRKVRESELSTADAEQQTLAFLRQHVAPRTAPLCGNSIWQDRRFLYRYMPELAEFVHYRNVDVSTVKELVRRWYTPKNCYPVKSTAHRALDDIRASIQEMRFYEQNIFVREGRNSQSS